MRIGRWRLAAAGAVLALVAAGCGRGTSEPERDQSETSAQGTPARSGSADAPAQTGAAGAPAQPAPAGGAASARPGAAGAPQAAPPMMVSGHAQVPALVAGSELPPGHPPISGPGAIVPPAQGSGEGANGLRWTVPAGWEAETPRSAMRRAQFRVPRTAGDSDDGECAVFYFGPGQGGTAESNALRWVDQFTQPDGSSSEGKAKIGMRSISGVEAMFVEVKGTYAGAGMPGMGSAAPKPGYALVGAIVPGPDAPWFFKFTGPAKTVEANRAAFESMIASIKQGS